MNRLGELKKELDVIELEERSEMAQSAGHGAGDHLNGCCCIDLLPTTPQ